MKIFDVILFIGIVCLLWFLIRGTYRYYSMKSENEVKAAAERRERREELHRHLSSTHKSSYGISHSSRASVSSYSNPTKKSSSSSNSSDGGVSITDAYFGGIMDSDSSSHSSGCFSSGCSSSGCSSSGCGGGGCGGGCS